MVCAFGNALVVFPATDTEIRPLSVKYHSEVGKLDYAEVEITLKAGELVQEIPLSDGEGRISPVVAELEVGGRTLARLALEPTGISVGTDTAMLHLRDPLVILERGIVDREFEQATLRNMVAHIVESREDPNEVIRGYNITDRESQLSLPEYESLIARWLADVDTDVSFRWPEWYRSTFQEDESPERGEELISDILSGALKGIKSVFRMGERRASLNFPAVTPREGLDILAEMFGIEYWVDEYGILWVGQAAAKGQPVFVGEEPVSFQATEVNIVDHPAPHRAVIAEGTYIELQPDPVLPNSQQRVRFRARSHAQWIGRSEGRIEYIEPRPVDDVDMLEAIVENRLRHHIYNSRTGHVVLNGLARRQTERKAVDIHIGDHLFLGTFEDNCLGRSIQNGIYGIRAVNHTISARDGWEISLDVGLLVNDNTTNVRTVITGPSLDGWVDADIWYGNWTPPQTGDFVDPRDLS